MIIPALTSSICITQPAAQSRCRRQGVEWTGAHRKRRDRALAPAKAPLQSALAAKHGVCWVMNSCLIAQHFEHSKVMHGAQEPCLRDGAANSKEVSVSHSLAISWACKHHSCLRADMSPKYTNPSMHPVISATHQRYASSMLSRLSREAASAGSGSVTAAGGGAAAAAGGAAVGRAAAGRGIGAAAASPALLPVLAASCASRRCNEVTWPCSCFVFE